MCLYILRLKVGCSLRFNKYSVQFWLNSVDQFRQKKGMPILQVQVQVYIHNLYTNINTWDRYGTSCLTQTRWRSWFPPHSAHFVLPYFSSLWICGEPIHLVPLLRFIATPEGATTRHFVVFFKSLTVQLELVWYHGRSKNDSAALRCAAEWNKMAPGVTWPSNSGPPMSLLSLCRYSS